MPEDSKQIQGAESDARKQAIAKSLSGLALEPIESPVIEMAHTDAIKLPLGQLTSLGAGFAALPEAFRTVTSTIDPQAGVQLFEGVLPQGATFKQAKDGLFSSSAQFADGTAAWGKFRAHTPAAQTVTTTVPVNPATLAMAAALAQVNQKLDGIQDTLDELFDYLRIKDKANVRASLDTLSAILSDYRYNWDNPQFKQAKYNLVQEINRDARQHIIELRAHLTQKTQKKSVIELRSKTENTAAATVEILKDYQLAVYLYSFSTFLGVMLLENYDQAYLQSKADAVRTKSTEYRQAYTDCFNAIESRGEKAADSLLLGGMSAGLRGLGHLVEKTPVGARTLIDEALIDAGAEIGSFNEKKTDEIVKLLIQAKDPAVLPFAQSIDAVNRVYNQPMRIIADGQNIYLLPLAA